MYDDFGKKKKKPTSNIGKRHPIAVSNALDMKKWPSNEKKPIFLNQRLFFFDKRKSNQRLEVLIFYKFNLVEGLYVTQGQVEGLTNLHSSVLPQPPPNN